MSCRVFLKQRRNRFAIRSPEIFIVTRIDIPHGFEYEIAEIGSASTKTTGEIKLSFEKSYGQFAELHLSNTGVVRKAA